MVEQKMSQIYLDLLRDKIDQKLLININVIRRAGRLPVVEAAQNDLCPNYVLVFQVPYLAGGKPQRENFPCNYSNICTPFCHINAANTTTMYPMSLAIRSSVITIFFPMM